MLLPANINAAIKHIDYQKGTYDGKGLNYLWFQIPSNSVYFVDIYKFYSSDLYSKCPPVTFEDEEETKKRNNSKITLSFHRIDRVERSVATGNTVKYKCR